MYDREPRVKRLPILFASKPADESLIIKEDGVPSLTNEHASTSHRRRDFLWKGWNVELVALFEARCGR